MGAFATVKSPSIAKNWSKPKKDNFELNMEGKDGTASDGREEGEIIDEFEDIISSDEEFSMRQRIKELEAKNAELEKIENISAVYGNGDYGYIKKDSCSHQADRYPLISINISDDEEYPPAPSMSRIAKRRKSLQYNSSRRKMVHSSSGHRRRKRSSSPPPAPSYGPSDKLLLSMFHDRVSSHSAHSSKRKRRSKKTHSVKTARKSREYYISDSDGDDYLDKYNVDVDDGFENFNSSDADKSFSLNREELRVALVRNTHRNEQHVSLKDRLIRRKENTDTLNEKTTPDEEEVQEEAKTDSPIEKTVETEDNSEERELRIIALKSAVLRKHWVRKKRNENIAYSPSDFDVLYGNIPVSPINNIEDEACNSMEISPVPSPKMAPSDEEGIDTKPVDMDIANSESECELPSYDKWVPIEQIPLPNSVAGEIYTPTPMRYKEEEDGYLVQPEARFASVTGSPANLDSEVEEEELALRALLLAKMNSPKVNKVVKEVHPKVEAIRTPDPDVSLEAEALRNFLISNMKKKTQPKTSSASVLKEAVRRLTARNASNSPVDICPENANSKTAEETDMELGQAITDMARVKIEVETKKVVKAKNSCVVESVQITGELQTCSADDKVNKKGSSTVAGPAKKILESSQTLKEGSTEVLQENVESTLIVAKKENSPETHFAVKEEPKVDSCENSTENSQNQDLTGLQENAEPIATEKSPVVSSPTVIDKDDREKISETNLQLTERSKPDNVVESSTDLYKIKQEVTATEKEAEKAEATPTPAEKSVDKNKPSLLIQNQKPTAVTTSTEKKDGQQKSPVKAIKVEKSDKPLNKPTPKPSLPKKLLPANTSQKSVPKVTAPQPTRTKIVKPNKVINQQVVDLKRKPNDLVDKPKVPQKKVKTEELTNRLITSAEVPQVKKLIIQLRASDTESEYSALSADDCEDYDGENSLASSFFNKTITIGNEYCDIASPISLPMESPCDTPTRVASPIVTAVQPKVEKSVINDFFEAKLDQFLKNVRSKVSTSSTSKAVENDMLTTAPVNTPVAVRHLPEASQHEYRRLINRMKLLERQKQAKIPEVVATTSTGSTITESRVSALNEGDSKTLAKRVLVKNANTAKTTCDKKSVEVKSPLKALPKKTTSVQKIAKTVATSAVSANSKISPQKDIPSVPPKPLSPKPSKENLLGLYENSYRKTGESIITNLNKSIELVLVAKDAKMSKLKHEHRLKELRKEMEEVQRNLQQQQARITKIYPEICSTHRVIESLKTRQGKLNKAVTALGRSVIGPSYSIHNEQKSIISEKTKSLAAAIKFVNTMKLSDVQKWESENHQSLSDNTTAIVATKNLSSPTVELSPEVVTESESTKTIAGAKDLNCLTVELLPVAAIKNVTETAAIETHVPTCEIESTTPVDIPVPEASNNLESNLNDTIVPEEPQSEEKEDPIDSTNGHEEPLETEPVGKKETSGTNEIGEIPPKDKEEENQMGGVKLEDYVSPLNHIRDERQINPNGIVCPYQLMGQCDDKDCKYMHLDER